jgi:choline dehydrogenase-like flavoprotein
VTSRRAIVIGSGAGGSVCALELARAGWEVTLIEEGGGFDLADYGGGADTAMAKLYRNRGMTPLLGRQPIAYVEGCCVGGSTEINSGFWRRASAATLRDWAADYGLHDASADDLAPHFAWAEDALQVGLHAGAWPVSTELFAAGAKALGWAHHEVPRMARGCQNTNRCASGCPTGAKQGVSRGILPRAQAAGTRLLTHARVLAIRGRAPHATHVVVERKQPGMPVQTQELPADAIFVACGAVETPSLLLRSGIRHNIGNSLQIHPMQKVIAQFAEHVGGLRSVLPLVQVTEFAPDISLGGSYLTPGHAAVVLSDNWQELHPLMAQLDQVAAYYVAVRGRGLGTVRPMRGDPARSSVRYELTSDDVRLLSEGMARLVQLLFAAGAVAVHTGVTGLATLRSAREAESWLTQPLPAGALNLSTVHAFASCPMGEKRDRTAADSFGRIWGWQNLVLADASCLPGSPGVNPQATVMAIARRNVLHYLTEQEGADAAQSR